MNGKFRWITGFMLLLITLSLLMTGCGTGVKSTKFTKDNIQQVLETVNKSKDLTGEEHALLTGAVIRDQFQKGNVLDGKTVGEAIEEQRRLKIEADAREAEKKRLAEEVRKKEEAIASELSQYLLVTFTKKDFRPKNIHAGEFEDSILITFAFKNNGAKNIRAFRGITRFNDLFGENLYSANLSREDGIKVGETKTWTGSLKYNQFMDEHKRFNGAEYNNIKFEWKASAIIFEDGTTLGDMK